MNKKNKKMRNKNNNQNVETFRSEHLPLLNTNVMVHHKYRFVASAAVTDAVITSNNLITAAGVVGTVVNSTVTMMFASVRLARIEVWGGAATAGIGTTISVEWTGTGNSPNIENSETSISANHPCHLRLKPPQKSLASFWQLSTASVNLFRLTLPIGAVVDIDVNLILSDTGAAATTLTGVTTVVLGKVYYLALDGINPASLPPVRLTTTT